MPNWLTSPALAGETRCNGCGCVAYLHQAFVDADGICRNRCLHCARCARFR